VQNPQTGEWFLEAPTGTRYRTAEDAVAGVAEKDRTITRLQAEKDAIARMVGGQPAQPAQPSIYDIMDQDLKNGTNRLQDTINQQVDRLVQERLDSRFGALQPMIQDAGLSQAARMAAAGPRGDPNIPAFVRSPAFRELTKTWPTLGNAIQAGSADPRFAVEQLPEILQLAYVIAKAQTAAPAAAPTQRSTPQTTTPPQIPVAPQEPQLRFDGADIKSRDPFERAMAALADIPLTRETLGR